MLFIQSLFIMKVPKKIINLLHSRVVHAQRILDVSIEIQEFLDCHGIEVEECDQPSGVEVYVNPEASAKRIIEAIENK